MERMAFCWKSRRWIITFDAGGYPKSCPYIGFQGNSSCVEEQCGYYEEREPSPYILRKLEILSVAYR